MHVHVFHCSLLLVTPRERPLAFYIFTESKANFDKVAGSTSSGAMVQNNTILYAGGTHVGTLCLYCSVIVP